MGGTQSMSERYVKLVDGVEVDMTAEEIAQRQAEEAQPLPIDLIGELDSLFKAQPMALQILFAGPKALAKEYADAGDWQTVRDVIEATPIPEQNAELANPVKAQLLALFEQPGE